jgi:hypothetical protein
VYLPFACKLNKKLKMYQVDENDIEERNTSMDCQSKIQWEGYSSFKKKSSRPRLEFSIIGMRQFSLI